MLTFALLNNVVDSVWAFEGGGQVREYVGGYDDWLRQRGPLEKAGRTGKDTRPGREEAAATTPPPAPAPAAVADKARRKLSYKEQRELEALPGRIAALEAEQAGLQASLSDPDLFVRAPDQAAAAVARLAAIDEELLELLERWEALENA